MPMYKNAKQKQPHQTNVTIVAFVRHTIKQTKNLTSDNTSSDVVISNILILIFFAIYTYYTRIRKMMSAMLLTITDIIS